MALSNPHRELGAGRGVKTRQKRTLIVTSLMVLLVQQQGLRVTDGDRGQRTSNPSPAGQLA